MTQDEIRMAIIVEAEEAHKEMHKLAKATNKLRYENDSNMKKMLDMKKAGKENTEAYKKLTKAYEDNLKQIEENTQKMGELSKSINVNNLTMAQLRKEASQLQKQMDNTSKSLNPEAYRELEERLASVKGRMAELKAKSSSLKEIFFSKTNLGFLMGSGIVGIVSKLTDVAIDGIGRVASRVKDLVTESVNAAREAEGITRAFERMDQPGLLDNLRKATHGTVTDLELMKAAVQANDFRLPLDQLGKYLEFAQMKARDTGQSVDYLVNSIVTGLGRKSKQILDNLGISAAQLDEEMKKDGDMAKAVGRIIDEQMEAAGEHFETAAEREQQATTKVTNAQLELGRRMQETLGIGTTSFSEMQAKAETFVLKGLTKLIIFCQDLYQKLASVRAVVEAVRVAFDSAFKLCEIGFRWLIDTVKGTGRILRDLAGITEGLFTFDFDKAGRAWDSLLAGIGKTFKEFVTDGKDVGERWGKNVIDSINATMGKAKVNSPKPANELDEVVVTGTRRNKKEQSQKGTKATTARDTAEEDLKKYRQNLEKLAVSGMDDAEKREHELQQQLLLLKGYYEASLSYAQQHGEDTEAIDQAYLKAREKLYHDYLAREEQERQKAEDAGKNQREQQAQQEEHQRQQQLREEEHAEQRRQQIRQQYGLVGQQEFYQMQLDQLKEYLDQELITTEEYEKAKKQLRIQNAKESFDYWSQQVGGAIAALQDAELAQVQAKYDAEIDAARKAGKDTTALEEKKAQEELKVQKKYADVNFAVKASQIIADTATSIMKAYADLGPIAGSVAASLMGVTGAAQLAVAKAERDKVKNMTLGGAATSEGSTAARVATGREDGGYLDVTRAQDGRRYRARNDPHRRGYVDRPTVIVGEGPMGQSKEWVASNAAVENPTIRPFIDAIDQAQRAGNVRTLDLRKVLLQQQGLQKGGYINGQRSMVNGQRSMVNGSASHTLDRLADVLDRMERNGIPALVGIDQVEARQQLRDRARAIAAK